LRGDHDEDYLRIGELKALARALRPYRGYAEVRVELAAIWKEIDALRFDVAA
jgi:hypothetical protein